ncbi:MAG: phosphatase PAP2 family protein [Rhodospirillales bacterium]|nr:phosphatase PAP2 family protein [Rhodospirillales bacterium]
MKAVAASWDAGALSARLAAVLRGHLWFAVAALFYTLCALVLAQYYGLPDSVRLTTYLFLVPATTAAFLLVFCLAYLVYVMICVRPKRLIGYLVSEAKEKWLTLERLAAGFLILLILPVFFAVFTSLKALIPVLNPFAWDATFLAWDRLLHGGQDPWRLLQPLFGYPLATSAINFLYQCWLFIVYGVLVWQAFSQRDPRLRMQFFLSFVAIWALIGSLTAMLLSSAGPVYFGRVTGLEDPYLPLMDYLRAVSEAYPVWALDVQEQLWQAYVDDGDPLGKGISAMPSMHVATVVLFALVAWATDRRLGALFIAYAVVVQIGSVHLAWHYALDGYVAALLTLAIWRAAGWWVARDRTIAGSYGATLANTANT